MNDKSHTLRAGRKDDHVGLALSQQASVHKPHNEFDDVEFVHHALSAIDHTSVTLTTTVDEFTWQNPFYINAMTGGTPNTGALNRELAIAAREIGVPIACGSVSVALDNPDDQIIQQSFTVIREEHPDGFVMANIGVERTPEDAVKAVDLLKANALQVHINAVQETAMPEGSREFSNWLRSLELLIAASPVPVIVKEVGFGLSARTLEQLTQIGATIADVSGKGGTDFLSIENARHEQQETQYTMLSGFGLSAMACLLDAPLNSPVLLASGGVRNTLDVTKALAAGAKAVGVSGVFLHTAQQSGAEGLINLMTAWRAQLLGIFSLLGATSPLHLTNTDLIISGKLAAFARARGVDLSALARRSHHNS